MQVTVVGANGGTGRLVVRGLAEAGHDVRAMVRSRDQFDQFDQFGQFGQFAEVAALPAGGARGTVTPVLGDLEGDFSAALEGSDALVFTAGSGSRTGPDKTLLVDLHGAVRTVDACVERGVPRYVMLSSLRADDPLAGREQIRHYLAAKHAADRILAASGLDHTIVRPGGLTDDPGTGRVALTPGQAWGRISRQDVAAVLVACLDEPTTIGVSFDLVGGDTPIREALRAL